MTRTPTSGSGRGEPSGAGSPFLNHPSSEPTTIDPTRLDRLRAMGWETCPPWDAHLRGALARSPRMELPLVRRDAGEWLALVRGTGAWEVLRRGVLSADPAEMRRARVCAAGRAEDVVEAAERAEAALRLLVAGEGPP